jgi:hypothetical protein
MGKFEMTMGKFGMTMGRLGADGKAWRYKGTAPR